MAYPFLYSFANSVLQKLDQCNLNEFGNPNDLKKDVEMLKRILNHLPSILETKSSTISVIQKCVLGLHDLLDEQLHPSLKSSWSDLVHPLIEFQDHLLPQSSVPGKSLLSSLSFPLPQIESQDVKVNNNLPLHLVPCLAYCAMYPKHSRIIRETLVNQWMAEGFLELQTPRGEPLESGAAQILPQLARLDFGPKRPDLSGISRLWSKIPKIPGLKSSSTLSLRLKKPDFRATSWPGPAPCRPQQTPGSSSGGSGDLELEDIGNRYFMELLSLGVFIKPMFSFGGDSTDQQAVTIHSCEIHPQMHDVARQMVNKEVLVMDWDFFGVNSNNAPSYIVVDQNLNEFELERLLRNYIRTCMFFVGYFKIYVPERIISHLLKLQILDLSGTRFEKLPASLGETGRLRYLAFSRNTLLKKLDNINWSSLQTLAVDGCVELEKVNLENTSHMRHLYYTSKEATLEVHTSTLRILQLSYCSELRWFSFTNSANFTCLRRLRIFQCPRLLSLPDSIHLFPHVEELVFHNCARLDLNHGRAMDSLPSVQYMELIGLPKLTKLPAGLRSAKTLLYLMIDNCTSLRSTDHTLLQHDGTLQKLCVYDCPNFSIEPNVFQSLTALHSLDIRNCPIITITSTSDACKYPAPFVSHIPEIFLDGNRLSDRSAGWSRKHDAARGPQMPSFGAQTDSFTPTNCPHFILSLESSEKIKSSQGMLDQIYKLKVPSRWVVLALALKAIVTLRILQQRKLYCCLFPSDYEFERDTLFQLWMARGFLPEHWEHFNIKCFNQLLDDKCIDESTTDILIGITKYKINVDKVNALSNRLHLNKDCYTSIKDEDTRVEGSTSRHHVSVVSKNIDEKVFQTLQELSELRSVLFLRDYGSSLKKIPSTFFSAHQYMQALDLSGSHISELPSSIGKMTCLRIVDLSFTLIERIPESIRLLTKLQTLKLRGCKHLHTLPKGMKELVNLYHLDFDVLGQLTSMPKELGFLTKLRTLSAFIVSEEDGCSMKELRKLNNLCGSFCISGLEYASGVDASGAAMRDKQYLTRLHLKWNGSKYYANKDKYGASNTLQFLSPHSNLKELHMSNYPGLDIPQAWMRNSTHLESITLLNCGIEKLDLGYLPNLRHLHIYEMNSVTEIRVRFPNLETLTIDGMSSLDRLWANQVDEYKLLSKISIKNCPKLPAFPFLPFLGSSKHLEIGHCKNLKFLPKEKAPASLETLIIYSCPLLKKRCSKGGEDWEKIENVPNIWIDMKNIQSSHEDTDSLSEDESEYSDDSD